MHPHHETPDHRPAFPTDSSAGFGPDWAQRPDRPGRRHPGRGGPHPRGRGGSFGPDLGDFGFGPGRPPGGRPGRRRGRRGDVRAAALLLIAEQPRHGYELIQEIADRSGGLWSPSPGSVYPVLQQLEDEGLIEFERVDGRKTASLTEAGTAYVAEHTDELGTPWESAKAGSEGVHELAHALRSLAGAYKQVAGDGTPEQRKAAAALLEETRRKLYGILAADHT